MKWVFTIIFSFLITKSITQEKSSSQRDDLLTKALIEENPIIAKQLLLENLEGAANKSDSFLLAFYNQLGFVYGVTLQNDSALHYLNAVLEMTNDLTFPLMRANAFSSIGNVYRSQSENEKAMNAYNQSLEVLTSEDEATLRMKTKVLGNIGGIYYDMNQPEKAVEYAYASHQLAKKYGFSDRYFIGHLMLAFAYREMGNLDSALHHNVSVLELLGSAGGSPYLAHTYYNIGTIHSEKNELDLANESFQKSMKIALDVGEYEVYVSDWIETAKLFRKKKEFNQSISTANEAVAQSVKYALLPKHIEALEELQKSQKLSGNFSGALASIEQIIPLKDSLFRVESMGKIQEIESKYQKKQDLQRIQDLENTERIQKLEAASARQMRIVLLIVLVLLVSIVIVLYNRFLLKIRIQKVLSEKNVALSEANQFKDRMFAIISHDLKSPLSSFSSITGTLNEHFERFSAEDIKKYLFKLTQASKSLEGQMKNLLEWAMSQLGSQQLKLETVNIKNLILELKNFFQLNLEIKKLNFYLNISEDISIETDREYLQTILRNLISNAIKFTPTGGSIWVNIAQVGEQLMIKVKDSGIGIAPSDFDKLFSLTADKKSIGNSSEKGTGLGLVLVKEMIDKLGGEIDLQSEPEKGTTFNIKIKTHNTSLAA